MQYVTGRRTAALCNLLRQRSEPCEQPYGEAGGNGTSRGTQLTFGKDKRATKLLMRRIRGETTLSGEETASSELEVLTRITPWRLTRRSRDSARWLLRGLLDAPVTLLTVSEGTFEHREGSVFATKGFCGAPS